MACPRHGAEAFDVVDLVLFEEELDPAGEASGDPARASDDFRPIVAEIVEGQAKGGRIVLELVIEVRIFEEGLGRNASPVEAGAAGTFHFNTGHFFSKLTGADGRDITAGASSDNDEIV